MRNHPIALTCAIVLLATQISLAQTDTTRANANTTPAFSQHTNAKLTYKITNVSKNTFGYDIYADGNLMIRQNSIPAMPGNKGFKTKTGADKVANLVIRKIKAGELPPTVTAEELKKLKVL